MNHETMSASDLFQLLDDHQVESVSFDFMRSRSHYVDFVLSNENKEINDTDAVRFFPHAPMNPVIENSLVNFSNKLISQHFSGFEHGDIYMFGKGSIEFKKDQSSNEWSVFGSCSYADEYCTKAHPFEYERPYSLESVQEAVNVMLERNEYNRRYGEDEYRDPMKQLAKYNVSQIKYVYFGDNDIIKNFYDKSGQPIIISSIDSSLFHRASDYMRGLTRIHNGYFSHKDVVGHLSLFIDRNGNINDVKSKTYMVGDIAFHGLVRDLEKSIAHHPDLFSYTEAEPFSYTKEELAAREEFRNQSLEDAVRLTQKAEEASSRLKTNPLRAALIREAFIQSALELNKNEKTAIRHNKKIVDGYEEIKDLSRNLAREEGLHQYLPYHIDQTRSHLRHIYNARHIHDPVEMAFSLIQKFGTTDAFQKLDEEIQYQEKLKIGNWVADNIDWKSFVSRDRVINKILYETDNEIVPPDYIYINNENEDLVSSSSAQKNIDRIRAHQMDHQEKIQLEQKNKANVHLSNIEMEIEKIPKYGLDDKTRSQIKKKVRQIMEDLEDQFNDKAEPEISIDDAISAPKRNMKSPGYQLKH